MVGFNYEKMKRWYELNIENSTDVLQKVATKSDIEVKKLTVCESVSLHCC